MGVELVKKDIVIIPAKEEHSLHLKAYSLFYS